MGFIIGKQPVTPLEVKKKGKAEYLIAGTETPVAEETENEVADVSANVHEEGEAVLVEPEKTVKKPGRKKKGGKK